MGRTTPIGGGRRGRGHGEDEREGGGEEKEVLGDQNGPRTVPTGTDRAQEATGSRAGGRPTYWSGGAKLPGYDLDEGRCDAMRRRRGEAGRRDATVRFVVVCVRACGSVLCVSRQEAAVEVVAGCRRRRRVSGRCRHLAVVGSFFFFFFFGGGGCGCGLRLFYYGGGGGGRCRSQIWKKSRLTAQQQWPGKKIPSWRLLSSVSAGWTDKRNGHG
jgi:hypothetical protein